MSQSAESSMPIKKKDLGPRSSELVSSVCLCLCGCLCWLSLCLGRLSGVVVCSSRERGRGSGGLVGLAAWLDPFTVYSTMDYIAICAWRRECYVYGVCVYVGLRLLFCQARAEGLGV